MCTEKNVIFRFNYLYILNYTNNINLIWRDNVFDYVNRNIQYMTMSVFTCTEYLKSKTLSTGWSLDLSDKPVEIVDNYKLNY